MLSDSHLSSNNGKNGRDNDGAKRVFFGGESFLEGIAGQAYVMDNFLIYFSYGKEQN